MGKHARNNTAAPVFTYHERKQLKKHWGTSKVRVGADSQVDYDACGICLQRAAEALVCTHGHIFCKGCVYEHLLSQTRHIKTQLALYDEQKAVDDGEAKASADQSQLEAMARFQAQESGILPGTTTKKTTYGVATAVASTKDVPTGYEPVTTPDGTVYVLTTTDPTIKKKSLPCFWIPSLTPEHTKKRIAKPQSKTMCPAGQHTLRRKQLRPLKFTELGTSEVAAGSNESRHICPMCRKSLTNATKISCLRKCGHIVCTRCVDKIVKPSNGNCSQCGKQSHAKDIVTIKQGGTSYAEGGSSLAVARNVPAFQSW